MIDGFTTTYMQSVPVPLTLWVRTPLRRAEFDTTLCDKVFQRFVVDRWFYTRVGTSVSSTNKTDRYDIAEILFEVALNTITLTLNHLSIYLFIYLLFYCSPVVVNLNFIYVTVSSKVIKNKSIASTHVFRPNILNFSSASVSVLYYKIISHKLCPIPFPYVDSNKLCLN